MSRTEAKKRGRKKGRNRAARATKHSRSKEFYEARRANFVANQWRRLAQIALKNELKNFKTDEDVIARYVQISKGTMVERALTNLGMWEVDAGKLAS